MVDIENTRKRTRENDRSMFAVANGVFSKSDSYIILASQCVLFYLF